ncbi:MAG: DNA alkylation repair protein [Candidatus Ryanbacteria bacterium]|nr:DNA alkylation repair protein [Candidatus Ryanbacteria bacterium]
MQSALLVQQVLKRLGTPQKAKSSAWFFKTGKGHYGHGDIFYGVTVPEQRRVAKEFKDLPLTEIAKLLVNPVHECRLTALLILVRHYQRADKKTKAYIAKFYISRAKQINNWDLVDASASYILGAELLDKKRDILYKLARSKNLWERRIAIVSTHAFIRCNDFTDTFKIAHMLMRDTHDLIHKATGWMLREAGKRDGHELELFLQKYASVMPRTMLRYAIEKFPEKKRKAYLSMPSAARKSASSLPSILR